MLDEATLRAQREAIIKQREDYIAQGNAQIAFFNGQIAMLEAWLNQPADSTAEMQPNGQHEAMTTPA